MSGIRSWLAGLGLERFADRFETEELTPEQIAELSEDDLEKLGLPMGPRKALMKAARLPAMSTTDAVTSTVQVRESAEAERRQITVMFCDLVGSTALSRMLDPEDLRLLMQSYQRVAGAAIERFGGHVAQYLGDGLMTYFGWPIAHEDDAERSVRAALEIVQAVKSTSSATPLQVRIGISTGAVVVGQTGAGDASVPKLAVGETPNQAARLQSLAGADVVIIGPATRRLIGETFRLRDLGEHALKGIAEPVRAWRVEGFARIEGRFEAARGKSLTPLIGREEELALLLRRWHLAKEGEGQVVLLTAEAGVGKSRLTQVLRERIDGEPHVCWRYQCSPHQVSSALYPFIAQLERAAGIDIGEKSDARLAKLQRLMESNELASMATLSLFASLLSISPANEIEPIRATPQKVKEMTLNALAERVASQARTAPLLLIFEDAHWIDPTSQEAIELLVSRLATTKVLLIISSRPDYQSTLSRHGHVTTLTLTRLPRSEAVAMVSKVAGGRSLPEEVVDLIVAKCDGIPLFVEEITKAVIESAQVVLTDDGYDLKGTLAELAIPATLHDSLMARLDRTPFVREVAQVASCIGREFSHALLRAVASVDDRTLSDALDNLVSAELMFKSGADSAAQYVFKHALVQDAAYASLIKSRRRDLHARIARVLSQNRNEVPTGESGLVAYHHTHAGQVEEAIPLWLKAGQASIARAAHREALSHLKQGLELLKDQPDTPSKWDAELTFQMNIGSAYNVLRGWSAPEVRSAYERARELTREISDPPRVVNTLMGLFYYFIVRGDVHSSTPIIDEAVKIARAHGSGDELVVAYQGLGQNLLYRARYAEALAAFGESMKLYDRAKHAYLSNVWGGDFFAYDCAFSAMCYWHVGRMESAREAIEQAVQHVESFDDPVVHTVGFFMAAIASLVLEDWPRVERLALRSEEQANAFGLGFHRTYCPILRGAAMIQTGRLGEGHALMNTNLDLAMNEGIGWLTRWLMTYIARSHASLGDANLGMTLLSVNRQREQDGGGLWMIGQCDIAEGIVLDSQGRFDDARAAFERAMTWARSTDSRGTEFRAALAYAQALRGRGNARAALALITPLLDELDDGSDTPDLRAARDLRVQVSS